MFELTIATVLLSVLYRLLWHNEPAREHSTSALPTPEELAPANQKN